MKKIIIAFCLFFLSFFYVYSQTEVDTLKTEVESDFETNLENIFTVNDLKRKYDIVDNIYKESRQKESILFSNYNYRRLSYLFELIRGVAYSEQLKDSIPIVEPREMGKRKIEYMPEEAVNEYIKQLDCTPGEAYRVYYNSIRNIKLKKELYLRFIDIELAKSYYDSEYAKETIQYCAPSSSFPLPVLTKLDFLKVFKEFIFYDAEVVLPDYFRVMVYLDCGCKTPYLKESSPKYDVENL